MTSRRRSFTAIVMIAVVISLGGCSFRTPYLDIMLPSFEAFRRGDLPGAKGPLAANLTKDGQPFANLLGLEFAMVQLAGGEAPSDALTTICDAAHDRNERVEGGDEASAQSQERTEIATLEGGHSFTEYELAGLHAVASFVALMANKLERCRVHATEAYRRAKPAGRTGAGHFLRGLSWLMYNSTSKRRSTNDIATALRIEQKSGLETTLYPAPKEGETVVWVIALVGRAGHVQIRDDFGFENAGLAMKDLKESSDASDREKIESILKRERPSKTLTKDEIEDIRDSSYTFPVPYRIPPKGVSKGDTVRWERDLDNLIVTLDGGDPQYMEVITDFRKVWDRLQARSQRQILRRLRDQVLRHSTLAAIDKPVPPLPPPFLTQWWTLPHRLLALRHVVRNPNRKVTLSIRRSNDETEKTFVPIEVKQGETCILAGYVMNHSVPMNFSRVRAP